MFHRIKSNSLPLNKDNKFIVPEGTQGGFTGRHEEILCHEMLPADLETASIRRKIC